MALKEPAPKMVPLLKEFPAGFDEELKKQREGMKTIVVVGFAPTSRDLPPYDEKDQDVEIWGLNEAYRHGFMVDSDGKFRADKWFQIHKPWSFQRIHNRNHPNHWLWLQNIEGGCAECAGTGTKHKKNLDVRYDGEDKKEETIPCIDCEGTGNYVPRERPLDLPIYMQEAIPEVPGSVTFPLQEIIDTFLSGHIYSGDDPIEYFTSSFAYICSLAMFLYQEEMKAGKLRIEVYGFEMSTSTEYHYQKGSTEFWLGMARGNGADIFVPHHCQLLKGAKYGYEVTQMINRQELEFRQNQLKELEGQKVAALNAVSGRRQEAEQEIQKLQVKQKALQEKKKLTEKDKGKIEVFEEQFKELMKQRQELMSKEINALSEANSVGGASQEIGALLAYVDAQYNFMDAEMPAREPTPSIKPLQTGVSNG